MYRSMALAAIHRMIDGHAGVAAAALQFQRPQPVQLVIRTGAPGQRLVRLPVDAVHEIAELGGLLVEGRRREPGRLPETGVDQAEVEPLTLLVLISLLMTS